MAKKKKSIELSDENITCTIDQIEYKIIRFHPSTMSVDLKAISEGAPKGQQNLPFAHLPKETKKRIKPN